MTYLSGATDCIKNNTQVRINTSITAEGTGAAVNLWRINGGAWKWSPDFGPFGRDSIWVEVQATDNTRTCIIGKKILVDEKTPLDIVSLTPSQHDDCTLNNAKIATQISGGQGSIQYKLNTGGFTSSSLFSNLSSARHLITVKDAANCQDTMSIRIAEPPLLQITSTSKANESDCPAGNAQITVNTSGVRGTLTLKVNNGSPLFSNVITNLSTGTYAIVAQDAAGCTANTSVSISELAQLSLSLSKLKEEDCIPGNANIVASTTGARGALSFRLDNGTAQTLGTFLNVPNGPHTVVAQDAAGCSASANLTIAEASQLQLPTPVVQAVNCSGASNGSISLSPTGGSAPYQYTWSNGRSTAVNQNLRAGTYAVTVTDAKGCKVTRSISVNEPTNIGVDLSIIAHSTCHGGSDGVLQSNVGGGSPPYAYTWDNGGTSSTISNLPANGYSLTVTDSHGCTGTASTSISQPASVTVSSTVSNHLDCIQNNVIITANASGGRGNYSYRLDGGALQASGVFSGKTTGAYSLIAQDGAGCNSLPSLININEALPLSLSYSLQNDQDCIAGNVNVIPIPSNAQGAVSYVIAPQGTWDFSTDLQQKGNGTYTLTALDGRNCTASSTVIINEKLPPLPITLPNVQVCSGTTATLNLIGAATNGMSFSWEVPNGATNPGSVRSFNTTVPGTYRVTMTDVNTGCSQTATGNVVHKPLPLVQLALSDTLTCTQSAIILEPPSTVSTSTYNWKTVSGAVLATTAQLRVDSAGTYILKVVDAANCTATDTITVLSYIPSVLQIDTFPSTRCDSANAQIRIQASHPGNWRYRIDSTAAWSNSPVFTGLRAGKYTLSIASPDTACIVDTTITIGSRETCIDLCAGDSLLIGTPGLNPWCMKWLPDAGLSNPDSSYTWVKPQSSTIYRLIITNDDGNIIDSLIYNVTLCPQLSISLATLNLCAQDSALLTASGGTGPYVWKNENGNIVASGATFKPSLPGTYIVEQEGSTALPATIQVSKNTGNNTLSIDAASFALCEDSLLLSARGNYRNLVWKDDQGVVVSNQTDLWVRQAGTYTLQGEIGMGCVEQKSASIVAAPFLISLEQASDTIDIDKYKSVANFYHNLSGTGRQTLGLLTPEGKTTIVELDKGCYDCGTVTIEVRDTLLSDSSLCQKNVKRTWIARNECGRKAMATQTLVVKDQKPPRFIDFPQDSIVVACGNPLPDEQPRASDNSGRRVQVTLQNVQKIARGFCDTVLVRFWRAIDSCGNDSIRKQIILIRGSREGLLGVGNPHPCGTPYQQPQLNQTLRQNLQAEDVIWMYGFPVKIWNVTGGAGTFSGNGLLTLPFQQQAVKVSFSSIQVNVDGKVIAGTMQAVRAPNQVEFRCPDPKEADFCPTFSTQKDSIAEQKRREAQKFKDCVWQGDPPVAGLYIDRTYDPNGFDCNGNYKDGGTTNEMGCTQKDMNDPKNSKCYGKVEPYAWLTTKDTLGPMTDSGAKLSEQIKDSIGTMVTEVLGDLIIELEELYTQQKVHCAGIRTETRNAFQALSLADSTYVFGSQGQYVKEGMWRQFSSAPKVLSLSASRQAGMEALEKKHVELYPCDKKQEELQTISEEAQRLQSAQEKGELIKWLNDLIRRLPADSVQAFQNKERFNAWIKRQIASRASQNAQAALVGIGNINTTPSVGFYQVEAPARGSVPELSSRLSNANYVSSQVYDSNLAIKSQTRQATINRLLDNGTEFIEGTHRAFYLQDIVRQKSTQFFPPDGNAKDTGAVLLPLSISKEVGGKSYSIILDNISFDATRGGVLNAYLILPAPGGRDSVVFQALNVPFTPGGADYNNAKLTLKCDAPLRLTDIAQLKLLANNQTYIEWDCNGFSKLNLAAEIEFCRNVLVPYDSETLKPAPDSIRLKATLATYITAWDDFTMGVSFSHPFGLSEDGGFLFRVSDAYIDMSDTKTPSDLKFPENYPFANAGNRDLWKGFYMKQFSIYLPQELDKSRAPRGVSLTDMVIDDQGVSVVASIPGPVVPLQDGNLDGWAFSIDSVLVKVLKNKFSGGGFGGLVNIPILSKASGGDITPDDCVRYTAMIEEGGRYTFSVQPATGKKIGMWFADVNLEKSSKIQVTYADRRFYAKAVLNGVIKVNTDSIGLKIKIPELRFQDLTVSNTAPYFDPGVWDRPTTSLGVKANFDGFGLGVDSVQAEGGASPGLGFRVRLSIGPENGGFNIVGGFKMKGRLDVSTGRQRWLPDGIEVKRFSVDGQIKGFLAVNGFVEHFKNKGAFGNGFWGGLDAQLLIEAVKGAGIKAVALFGTTPDETKYFMVDAMGLLPKTTPGIIKGFGGGVWNHMQAQDSSLILTSIGANINSFSIGQSLTGIKYQPSSSAGLGLKASLLLGTADGKAFNALVALSAQFNDGGGLNDLSMTGLGTMLKESNIEGRVDTNDASIRVGVNLKYSFSQKAFDGLLQVNAAIPGALTASGEAKIHFSDKKWFIHIGTPQKPIRANFQIPLVGDIGAARMYLDLGSELPPPASLPSYFTEMGISSSILAGNASQGGGGGVMFGVGLDFKANFDKLKPLYANMNINLGADLALIDYGNATCSTTGKPIGFNGWYASGQVYAYLRASVGLQFKNKQFPIAELAVGAALQGKMPNPTFARGAVGGSYRILGGLVKGKFNLQFTLGQDCGELQDAGGTEQSLEQNYQIIAALRPEEGAANVATTAIPAADFQFPMNSTLESYDDNGNPIAYLVELDGSPVLMESVTQSVVPARATLSTDGRTLKFQPFDALADSTRFTFIVRVKYSKNGTVIGRQEKQVTFTTGAAATTITPANIVASYPISGMQHFYPGEYASEEEFIELSQGQADLFKGSNAPKAILLSAAGAQLWQGDVQYNLSSKRISFNFPNEILRPGQCYTLEIRRLAQAGTRANDNNGGTSLPPGLLTTLNFCTSNYQTFQEKATAFAQGATRTLNGYQVVLSSATEAFDELETGGGYGGSSFVKIETNLYNNAWYQAQKNLLYKEYRSKFADGVFQFIPLARNGTSPDQAVSWTNGGKALKFDVLLELTADFQDFRNQVQDYEAALLSKCTVGTSTTYASSSSSSCSNCCVLPEFLPSLKAIGTPLPRMVLILCAYHTACQAKERGAVQA
ncbi:hypothetical protein [Haliscomenobacter sp.]|uniref:hypothetical protein n=1 Tax=Haliscomenobacter sp. TaxID=2717303 RepID=UPI0033650FE8